ncbi:MAG: shikimate kinase [Pseudobdellovibrionaceae bacterium]
MELKNTIIFIGPMGSGKTTISRELSKITNKQWVPLDRVRWYYYYKNNYSNEKEFGCNTLNSLGEYWKSFERMAVIEFVKDFSGCILDFGAGHSYYPDENDLSQVKLALKDCPYVFFLIPSKSHIKSLEICTERIGLRSAAAPSQEEIELNLQMIKSTANARLATYTIFTAEKSVADVVQEVLGKVKTKIC